MIVTSKQEARRTRVVRAVMFASRLALAGAIWFVAAGRAEASPYTVTDLGNFSWAEYPYGPNMADFGFVNTTRPLTSEEMANLPTYSAYLAEPPPHYDPPYRTVTMQPIAINDSGTVIGRLATSVYRDGSAVFTEVGYAVRSPDGHYAPFVPLNGYEGLPSVELTLSQANQILMLGEGGVKLVDVNTGTTTPITQVIPPELLTPYSNLIIEGFDDRGDILVRTTLNFDLKGNEYYILTPPGLDPPAVPEPSTLLIFAAAGALAVRASRRRGSA